MTPCDTTGAYSGCGDPPYPELSGQLVECVVHQVLELQVHLTEVTPTYQPSSLLTGYSCGDDCARDGFHSQSAERLPLSSDVEPRAKEIHLEIRPTPQVEGFESLAEELPLANSGSLPEFGRLGKPTRAGGA